LIDTFDKSRGDLWSATARDSLRCIIRRAHDFHLRVALAGSLTLRSFHPALRLAPDWLAVRGAACLEGRESNIEAERVSALKEALNRSTQKHQLMHVVSKPKA
jgi:uncharacterized protein (UPF0264 family)